MGSGVGCPDAFMPSHLPMSLADCPDSEGFRPEAEAEAEVEAEVEAGRWLRRVPVRVCPVVRRACGWLACPVAPRASGWSAGAASGRVRQRCRMPYRTSVRRAWRRCSSGHLMRVYRVCRQPLPRTLRPSRQKGKERTGIEQAAGPQACAGGDRSRVCSAGGTPCWRAWWLQGLTRRYMIPFRRTLGPALGNPATEVRRPVHGAVTKRTVAWPWTVGSSAGGRSSATAVRAAKASMPGGCWSGTPMWSAAGPGGDLQDRAPAVGGRPGTPWRAWCKGSVSGIAHRVVAGARPGCGERAR